MITSTEMDVDVINILTKFNKINKVLHSLILSSVVNNFRAITMVLTRTYWYNQIHRQSFTSPLRFVQATVCFSFHTHIFMHEHLHVTQPGTHCLHTHTLTVSYGPYTHT